MVKRITLAVTLVVTLSLIGLMAGIASGQNVPGSYDFTIDVQIENNTAEEFTGLVPFVIDAALLGSSSFVNSAFTDVIFTDSADSLVNGMVEDITSSSAFWWIESETIPAGSTVTQHTYTSGPAEEKYFPLDARSLTRIETMSTSTLEIDDFLIMSATAESSTCGTILGKTNLAIEDNAAGYGIYNVGIEDFPQYQGSLQGLSQFVFYDITPLVDFWICGAGFGFSTDTTDIERIRVENNATSAIVLDTVPVYIPDTQNTGLGSSVLFRDIALLEAGVTYHIYFDAGSTTFARQVVFGGGFPALMNATGTIAFYEQPSSTTSFDSNTYRAPGFQVDDTFSGTGIVGVFSPGVLYSNATSSAGRLETIINCNVIDFNWTGDEVTLSAFYSTSVGEIRIEANGFPFTFPFPSCQTFGNKQGGEDLGTLALADYLNPGSERVGGTLFTPPIAGDLDAINAKIRWDRGGNGTAAAMTSILQAALYDSTQNLIAQTDTLSVSLPDPADSHIESYRMTFTTPPAIATSSSYYLMVWADNVVEGSPATLSSFNGGNADEDASDYSNVTTQAQVVRFCDVDEADLIGFANEIVFLESIRVHMASVTGATDVIIGLYEDQGGNQWDLLEAANASLPISGYATADFSGTTELDPSNEQYRIAFLTNEGSTHTAKFTTEISGTSTLSQDLECNYQVTSPAYPSLDTSLDMALFHAENGGNAEWGIDEDPFLSTGSQDFQSMLYGVQVRKIVQQTEIHLTTIDETGTNVVYDSEAYDASFPDPFTIDNTQLDKVAAIWGDVIPSTTETIATSTDPLIIGSGLTGKIDEIAIAEVGPRLHYQFEPDQISNTQQGSAGNNWLWQGTITDQTPFLTDGIYHITSDISGLAITVLPLGASAAAVPLPTPGFPNIYGNPDVASAVIPIPTAVTNPTIQVVRDAIEGNDLQEETAYIFLASFILALISSLIMKALPYDFIPWVIGISGFAILSQFAGPFFLMIWVIMYGLQATGLWLVIKFAR